MEVFEAGEVLQVITVQPLADGFGRGVKEDGGGFPPSPRHAFFSFSACI